MTIPRKRLISDLVTSLTVDIISRACERIKDLKPASVVGQIHGTFREIDQVRRATAIARAETRRDDARARHGERGLRPQTLQAIFASMRPHFLDTPVREQIVNVPVHFLVGANVAREALRQTVHRTADVEIIAARKLELAERADANRLGARKMDDERVRAARSVRARGSVWHRNLVHLSKKAIWDADERG